MAVKTSGKTIQDIKKSVRLVLKEFIPKSQRTAIEKKIEEQVKENILRRLNAGIDGEGKRIRKLTQKYKEAKYKMIKGKWKMPRDTTEYRAVKVPNFGRLTGQKLSNLIIKAEISILKSVVQIRLQSIIPKKFEKEIEGLHKRGRKYYYALAEKGAYQKSELESIRKILRGLTE